jgi:hypothetical protein
MSEQQGLIRAAVLHRIKEGPAQFYQIHAYVDSRLGSVHFRHVDAALQYLRRNSFAVYDKTMRAWRETAVWRERLAK